VVGARRLIAVVAGASALWMVAAGPAAAQPLTCGQVITQDTRLDSDLNCFGTGVRAALFIGADGITLDLRGHTISASRSIIDDGHDNVTIRNGTLDNDDGPLIQGASGTRLRNLRFQGISYGLDISDSDHTDVRRSEFPGAALLMRDGSSWNTVARNRFSFSEGTVNITRGSHHNRVVDNDLVGPSDADKIWLYDADDNRIAHNRMSSLFNGITLLAGSDRNTIVDNVIRPELAVHQFDIGISLSDSSHNLVRGNTVTGNLVGLRVRSGAGNWLVGNSSGETLGPIRDDEDADGVRVEAGATGTVLAYNRADRAADDGIDVEAPGTALRGNRADDNADLGIEAVPGIIDLGGNLASGNGNPLQCLNVVCR
jgi:parallel beta-helix repeat protein/adhesin HecA-like repeat protein